nr:flagellar basal body-associated FliL family protein [Luteimonas saliphila]
MTGGAEHPEHRPRVRCAYPGDAGGRIARRSPDKAVGRIRGNRTRGATRPVRPGCAALTRATRWADGARQGSGAPTGRFPSKRRHRRGTRIASLRHPPPESTFVPAPATATQPAVPAKPKRRLWPLLLILVVVLAGAGGGGWWWWQGRQQADAEATPAKPARLPAQYVALEPSFVVNLADDDAVRYLQADVQLVTRDPATLKALETHGPSIRNRLLLLFGQQQSRQLAQRAGKERLQQAARDEVRALLKAEGEPDKVEAVIFTSLVTQ